MSPEELAERLQSYPAVKCYIDCGYIPFIFHLMTGHEREVLLRWHETSKKDWSYGDGASGFVAMSTIGGFLLGSAINNLVQCGHYIGFSSIILGSMFRFMGKKHAIYSMDVHERAHNYTLKWIDEAGLNDYVKCVLTSSDNPDNVENAKAYFDDDIQTVFIDSAHTYRHTLRELGLWFPALQSGGIIFMHDVSELAKAYDGEGHGGVRPAALEFLSTVAASGVLLNGSHNDFKVYGDPCGLGIIQKT